MADHTARASLASRMTSVCRGLVLLACGSGIGGAAVQAQLLPSSPNASVPQVERWNGNSRARQGGPGHPHAVPAELEAPGGIGTTRLAPSAKALLPPGEGERILPPLKPIEPLLLVPPPAPAPPPALRPAPAVPPPTPVVDTARSPAGPTAVSPVLGDGCTWETLKNLVWLVKESTTSLRTCVDWFKDQQPRREVTPSPAASFEPASVAVSQGAARPGALHPQTLETAMPLSREAASASAEPRTQASNRQEIAREVPWRQLFLLQLPGTLVALLGGPLIAVALILVLRRSGVLFRVEMVNPVGYVVHDASPQPAPALPSGNPLPGDSALSAAGFEEPVAEPPEEPSTAEAFDLGLTYEEEKRLQDQAQVQLEQAVLQRIFEDNRQLQQEIRQLTADDTPAAEGTTELPAKPAGASETAVCLE